MNSDLLFFSLLAFGSIFTALLTITRRNPVMSVIFLIANFFFLAVLYLTLYAQFIAIIQILVYAGAIMVLFLFVIMLLNLGSEQQLVEVLDRKKFIVIGLCMAMLVQLVLPLYLQPTHTLDKPGAVATEMGTVESMGKVLFTTYAFPFEVVSVLLLAAIVGAVVLAKKKFQ